MRIWFSRYNCKDPIYKNVRRLGASRTDTPTKIPTQMPIAVPTTTQMPTTAPHISCPGKTTYYKVEMFDSACDGWEGNWLYFTRDGKVTTVESKVTETCHLSNSILSSIPIVFFGLDIRHDYTWRGMQWHYICVSSRFSLQALLLRRQLPERDILEMGHQRKHHLWWSCRSRLQLKSIGPCCLWSRLSCYQKTFFKGNFSPNSPNIYSNTCAKHFSSTYACSNQRWKLEFRSRRICTVSLIISGQRMIFLCFVLLCYHILPGTNTLTLCKR